MTKMNQTAALEAVRQHLARYPECDVKLSAWVEGVRRAIDSGYDDGDAWTYSTTGVGYGVTCAEASHGDEFFTGDVDIRWTADRGNAAWQADGAGEDDWDYVNAGADEMAAALGCTVRDNEGGYGDARGGEWSFGDTYRLVRIADRAADR